MDNRQHLSAIEMSRKLSKLYRQIPERKWRRLSSDNLSWGLRRCRLEIDLDKLCVVGEIAAAQEPFRQLVEHLQDAIDEQQG